MLFLVRSPRNHTNPASALCDSNLQLPSCSSLHLDQEKNLFRLFIVFTFYKPCSHSQYLEAANTYQRFKALQRETRLSFSVRCLSLVISWDLCLCDPSWLIFVRENVCVGGSGGDREVLSHHSYQIHFKLLVFFNHHHTPLHFSSLNQWLLKV